MKKRIAFGLIALFAFGASAQAPMARPNANGIVYSFNPLPPTLSNGRLTYPAGSSYVDASGHNRICNTPLVIERTRGFTRAVCNDQPAVSADALANLAPAAGGPRPLSDRNLTSDRAGLRSDRAMVGVQ